MQGLYQNNENDDENDREDYRIRWICWPKIL